MSSRKLNKFFNKLIILLIFLVIVIFGKEKFSKLAYDYEENNNIKLTENISNNKIEIYFFDVGQADSILIKQANSTVLIDAGNNKDGDNLVNYIKDELNINHFDVVIGTHPHEDHIGGLDNIISEFDIDKIYLPDAITTSKTFEDVIEAIENKEYKITIPKIGEKFSLNKMNFEILYTGTDENDLNKSSIVLKINYYNTNYLFMGDLPSSIEKELLEKNISSEVIKIGHHGSKYSSSLEFLKKVNPTYAIISVGKNNNYNHPSKETLEKLNNLNIKTYRTDEVGTIKLTSDGNSINIETIKTFIDG